jgi:HSF-type DNA-binding
MTAYIEDIEAQIQQPNDNGYDYARNFASQLHVLLNNAERDGIAHLVSWQPHGRAFLVHNKDEFVNTILPRYVQSIGAL